MNTWDALEGAFELPAHDAGPRTRGEQALDWTVTPRYERRLASLLTCEGGRFEQVLRCKAENFPTRGYPSRSHAIYGLIGAMAKRHFTPGEMWRTLKDSPIYNSRCEDKGEAHAEAKTMEEIERLADETEPFEDDPGAPVLHLVQPSPHESDSPVAGHASALPKSGAYRNCSIPSSRRYAGPSKDCCRPIASLSSVGSRRSGSRGW